MSQIKNIHYQIEIASLAGHLFNVTQSFQVDRSGIVELSLPAWIPGSYMIRDFARNIISIKVHDQTQQNVTITKTDKQTWQIQASNKQTLTVTYQIYAFDLSVRSAYINDQYAFFNGTSLFLQVNGLYNPKCTVEIVLPEHLSHWAVATSLPQPDTTTNQYEAASYQSLIDHPFIIGEFDTYSFNACSVEFELILAGGHNSDTERMIADLKKICKHHLQLFQQPFPMQRYLFITLLCDSGFGGLEHSYSTVLQYARNQLPSIRQQNEMPEGYRTSLSLCSHELFHTWHVKSTRPKNMLNPDLSQEVYTEQLWIYEGFTSYFDDITLLRCGLVSSQEYLQIMATNMTRLARNPGANLQTITESSFDAWTRFYKQDENAANSIVSYYTKGAVVAMCLDLKMRLESNHKHNLFDLVKLMWKEYGLTNIGTDDDVIHCLLKQHFNLDLDDFLNAMLYSTKALPDKDLLREFGVELLLRPRIDHKDKGGKASDVFSKHDFGATYTSASLGININQIITGQAAYMAGLQVNDQVIALDYWQVNEQSFQQQLDNCNSANQTATLTVLRDGRILNLSLPIRPAKPDTVVLNTVDEKRLANWLNAPKNNHHDD